jgi:hypothetical protein
LCDDAGHEAKETHVHFGSNDEVFSLLSHGNSGKGSGNHGAKRHVVIFWLIAIAEHLLNFN